MSHRVWFLSVVAMSVLAMTSWAYGQQMSGQNMGMTTSPNRNQQQQSTNQNGQQSGNQKANEQPQPVAPRFLTYTKEANPGLKSGKAGKSYLLNFSSAPVGADVYVNGYFMGHTPTTVQIPAGEYLVTVQKWGYREWVKEFVVSRTSPLNVRPDLKPDW